MRDSFGQPTEAVNRHEAGERIRIDTKALSFIYG